MLKTQLLAGLAVLLTCGQSSVAQVPPPGGGGGSDLPFQLRTFQTWGRAKAKADDGIGPAAPVDEDYQPSGPQTNSVYAEQFDGAAKSQSSGEMKVELASNKLECSSMAYGIRDDPGTPGSDVFYNVRARTEAAGTNAAGKVVDVAITVMGLRSQINDSTTGWCKVQIIEPDGDRRDVLHIKMQTDSWKVVGGQSIEGASLTHEAGVKLKPGERIGLTCVAEADSGALPAGVATSLASLTVKVEAVSKVGVGPPQP